MDDQGAGLSWQIGLHPADKDCRDAVILSIALDDNTLYAHVR